MFKKTQRFNFFTLMGGLLLFGWFGWGNYSDNGCEIGADRKFNMATRTNYVFSFCPNFQNLLVKTLYQVSDYRLCRASGLSFTACSRGAKIFDINFVLATVCQVSDDRLCGASGYKEKP